LAPPPSPAIERPIDRPPQPRRRAGGRAAGAGPGVEGR